MIAECGSVTGWGILSKDMDKAARRQGVVLVFNSFDLITETINYSVFRTGQVVLRGSSHFS